MGFIFFATADRGRGGGGRGISKFTQSKKFAQIHTEREKEGRQRIAQSDDFPENKE